MTDRVDSYLEGALDRSELTAEERAQADAIEGVVDETEAFVDARPALDVTASVMRELDSLTEERARSLGWPRRLAVALWTARRVSFDIRPAYGLVAAAAVAAVMALWPSASRPVGDDQAAFDTQPRLFVQFRLQAADASSVRLAGSFTNWQPQYELRRTAADVWTITIPLSPGVHDYAFVLDGERWIADPYAPAVDDGFGGTNSRIALVVPENARL